MKKLTQKELNNIVASKKRINLSNLDLTNANLSSADLTCSDLIATDLTCVNLTNANLTDTDLTNADLTGADLTNANLMGANLTNANLMGANLKRVCLWAAIGNDSQIKNIHLGRYPICYTYDILQIGCKNHKIGEWFNFDDKTINEMGRYALKWWKQNKTYIFETINNDPAKR